MTSKLAQVYLDAAELLEDGNETFSCWAIDKALHDDDLIYTPYTPERRLYSTVMDVAKVAGTRRVIRVADEIGISPLEFRFNLLAMMAACCDDFAKEQP